MKTLFLINPNAGRPRDLDEVTRLISSAAGSSDLDYEIVRSHNPADVEALISEAKTAGIELICAVGGDGTVSEVGRHLTGTETALGIIPLGSGNGLARHLGIPCNLEGAMKTFRRPRIERIDTGLIAGAPFLGICGLGLDAEVAHRFASSTARGLRTYITEGLATWYSCSSAHYEIEIDGEQQSHEAYLIAFANSGQYGNEARVAPLASLRDGLIDVSILHDASLARAPSLLYRLFSGSFHQSGAVTTHQGKRIEVIQQRAAAGHIDGDPVELPSRFEVTVREASLRVLVPAGVDTF